VLSLGLSSVPIVKPTSLFDPLMVLKPSTLPGLKPSAAACWAACAAAAAAWAGVPHRRRRRLLGAHVDHGAEVDRAAQFDLQVLDEHRCTERHVRIDVIGQGQAQVHRFQLGLHRVVAADPVAVVLRGETEGCGQGHAEMQVFLLAERQMEVGRRDRRDLARIAAVAARDRATGTVEIAALAVEFGAEADDAQVGLDLAAVQLAHGGRVDGDDRGIAFGTARARKRTAQALGAVFLQLEGGGMHVAVGQRGGDAEGQRGSAGQVLGEFHQ
jgi:hypothetical protein